MQTKPLLLALLALALIDSPLPAADAAKPNIVVLLCDDLGYGDLSCFAHPTVRSPNLDRLASEGLRLTHCYSSSPVCSPSRAGLMTGRNHNRLGIYDWIPKDSGIFMRPREVTVAQLLKRGGYRTCHVGKWHLNSRTDGSEPTPGDAGFEHWLYTQNNAAPGHLNLTNFVRNGKAAGLLPGPSSHTLVAEATRWLDGVRGQPFFLNVWFHETHEPVVAAEEFLGLYPGESNPDKRHYLGDVTQMDAAVGKLLKYLTDHGLRDNTFIFFSSDNGPETLHRYPRATRSYGSPGPLRGMKLHITEGGYRVPGILFWPGHTKPGTISNEPVCNVDLLPTFCALRKSESDFKVQPGLQPTLLVTNRGGLKASDMKTVDQVVHERMARRPFVTYEDFDVASYVDYGQLRYDKHENDPRRAAGQKNKKGTGSKP